jgi:CSLREA domain-containing protein
MIIRTMFRYIASIRLVVCAAGALIAGAAAAATITVTSTADIADANDGLCTLREAITSANSNIASGGVAGECLAGEAPASDTIEFDISGAGVHTISPSSPMPTISQIVTIDGYTQGTAHANTLSVGNDALLLIEIDGTNVSGNLFNIVGGGSSTLRGLVVNRLAGTAIYIDSSDSNKVTGNFFGTDPSGNTFQGTTGTPIQIRGNANVIGGTTPADRNVIVGGGGVNAGTILLVGLNGGNFIQGNYIGVSADGATALQPPGGTDAIEILISPNTTIGGTTAGARNVIVGTIRGIRLGGGGQTTNETVQGNYIGTNATGTAGLGGQGITTDNGASNLTIGGGAAGAGNVISGGSTAIFLGDGASAVTIRGNKIGTDASGTQPIPNSGNGIDVQVPGAGSVIGGINPGEGNTIAFNCGRGISIGGSTTYTQWAMLGNAIYSNGGLGITLTSSDQPLANDTGDGDTGANNRQNYPMITSAPISAGIATISGTLNSEANKTYRIEFFASDRCDASGFGEGRMFVGTAQATTDDNGNTSFSEPSLPLPAPGVVFTATATDPDGNTSEFSQCFGTPDKMFANGFEPSCGGG